MLRSRHQMVESSGLRCATLMERNPRLPGEETPRRDSGSIVSSRLLHTALAAARMVPSARGLSPHSSPGFTNNQAEHQHPAQPTTRCSPAPCLH
ncbi:hypothetical protein JOQ06_003964, partial [Pogonophryne albipinna]